MLFLISHRHLTMDLQRMASGLKHGSEDSVDRGVGPVKTGVAQSSSARSFWDPAQLLVVETPI